MTFTPFGQVTSAGQQAYQFTPETYGAVGNGKIATDITSVATSKTYTSPTVAANATAGQWILINGANGNPGVPVIDTIASVNPGANQFTLTTQAAGSSVSNCQGVFGTDDSAAFTAALNAAQAYALAGNYMCQLILGSKIYIHAGLTQSNIGGVTYNAQLPVPYPAANGQTRKLLFQIKGAGYRPGVQYWESLEPNMAGSAIMSMRTAPATPDATFGIQSVIGGITSGTFTGGFQNTHLDVENCSVWCGAYTNIKGIDATLISGMHLDGYESNIFAPANNLAGASSAHPYLADLPAQALFQNSKGIGIVWPNTANNDALTFGDIAVEGYEVGMDNCQDHLTGLRYAGLYCDVLMRANPATSHELAIQSVSAEVYNGGLRIVGGASMRLNLGWDAEGAAPAYDLNDGGNICTGQIRWTATDRAQPLITGGAKVLVLNETFGPGHIASPPAVPASTVTATLVYRPCAVTIHTGVGVTVSAITVDGTAEGITLAASSSAQVRVPSGKTIALTYAGGTPTWDWWAD